MDTAMPEEKLRAVFDRSTREVTEGPLGIPLTEGDTGPERDLYTVHIGFHQGFHSSLSLRADAGFFSRMVRTLLQTEAVSPQDLEDVAKEYFNVLCGHIAKAMYQATKVASRFDVPAFCPGYFFPPGQREQFSLCYTDDQHNAAQLIHYVPDRSTGGTL